MEDVEIRYMERPKLQDPIFIEGLPGVGNVGKLAAEHLIDELKAVKFADVFSRFFPPQVLVEDSGLTKLVRNELYYYRRNPPKEGAEANGAVAKGPKGASGGRGRNGPTEPPSKGAERPKQADAARSGAPHPEELDPKTPLGAGRDLLILVGDYQGLSSEGQYTLSSSMLDVARDMGARTIFTLGGYGLGRMVMQPNVLGAATHPELVEYMKARGVQFKKGEPGSGIVGASGLLLGLGVARGFRGVCLMGETSGYFVDPKSAQAVLEILVATLGVSVGYAKLEEKAEQIERLEKHLKDMEAAAASDKSSDDLRYIG